jgi:tRNA A58 N-methylase Trm61
MFIAMETWSQYSPVQTEDGFVLVFETREEANSWAHENLQLWEIIEGNPIRTIDLKGYQEGEAEFFESD